ncbi:MAG: hypothetical protein R2854_20575 [Caldilineaceae bacterium]
MSNAPCGKCAKTCRGFYRELPILAAPDDQTGYPRIYAVAARILVETGAGVRPNAGQN